jgi:outer membrane protein assembly factor BamB
MKKRSILAVLVLALAPAAFGQAMFRGDLAHSGVYVSPGPQTLKGVAWTFAAGGPVLSSPALADGVLYIGSDDGKLYALEAATGKKKWELATEGPVRSSPAVLAGTVYFGSYDGQFRAVDAATGEVSWTFATPGERKFQAAGLHGSRPPAQIIPDLWDLYLSSPAVTEDRVYFGSGDGNVYSLDAHTGQLMWKVETKDVVHSSPALVDGVLYVGSWDSNLYAIDADTGQQRWRFKTGEDPEQHNQVGIQSSPAVVDGVVYFGCRDGHLYAVDADTGKKRWAFTTKPTWIIASPAVRDGAVYFGTSIPPAFYALDAESGEPRLKLDLPVLIFSSTALSGPMAYFGSFDGKLHAIDLEKGAEAWQFQTEASKQDADDILQPDGAVNFGAIFSSSFFEDSYLAARKLFSVGSILSSPAVQDGLVYFGSADGNVYALQ